MTMTKFIEKFFKPLILLLLFISTYYLVTDKNNYERATKFTFFHSFFNIAASFKVFLANNITTTTTTTTTTIATTSSRTIATTTTSTTTTSSRLITTTTSSRLITTSDKLTTTTTTTTVSQTTTKPTTAGVSTAIDPAKILVERTPSPSQLRVNLSNTSLAVFVSHTRHFVLTDLQLYLIRKLAINLVGVEIFLDGPASTEMRQVADKHKAGLYSLSEKMHKDPGSPSDRNADVVNWALATKAKSYLKNGTAVLLLDGDVFPLSHFDADTLLNSRDIVC
jgi:hypothetical protein